MNVDDETGYHDSTIPLTLFVLLMVAAVWTAGAVREVMPNRRMWLAAFVRASAAVVCWTISGPVFDFAAKALLFLAAYGLLGHVEGKIQSSIADFWGVKE